MALVFHHACTVHRVKTIGLMDLWSKPAHPNRALSSSVTAHLQCNGCFDPGFCSLMWHASVNAEHLALLRLSFPVNEERGQQVPNTGLPKIILMDTLFN